MKILTIALVSVLAITGCKKTDDPAANPNAGSSVVVGSSSGSAMAGSSTGSAEAGGRPEVVTDAMITLADKAATAIDTMATEVDAAKDDCKKAVDAVKHHDAALAALAKDVAAARTVTDKDPVAKAYMQNYMKDKLTSAVGKLMGVAMKCKEVGNELKSNPLFRKDTTTPKAPAGSGAAAKP